MIILILIYLAGVATGVIGTFLWALGATPPPRRGWPVNEGEE